MNKLQKFPAEIPFLNWLGVEYLGAEKGKSSLRLAMQKHHTNSFSVAHGGVQMTVLDVAMAMAARSLFNDPDATMEEQFGVVTIEMKSTFLAPAMWSPTDGGALLVNGICLKRTAKMAFCESEIVDAHGTILSKASGTFRAIKARA
jgi:uncharacterized protein (TIGR00369 family)